MAEVQGRDGGGEGEVMVTAPTYVRARREDSVTGRCAERGAEDGPVSRWGTWVAAGAASQEDQVWEEDEIADWGSSPTSGTRRASLRSLTRLCLNTEVHS